MLRKLDDDPSGVLRRDKTFQSHFNATGARSDHGDLKLRKLSAHFHGAHHYRSMPILSV